MNAHVVYDDVNGFEEDTVVGVALVDAHRHLHPRETAEKQNWILTCTQKIKYNI